MNIHGRYQITFRDLKGFQGIPVEDEVRKVISNVNKIDVVIIIFRTPVNDIRRMGVIQEDTSQPINEVKVLGIFDNGAVRAIGLTRNYIETDTVRRQKEAGFPTKEVEGDVIVSVNLPVIISVPLNGRNDGIDREVDNVVRKAMHIKENIYLLYLLIGHFVSVRGSSEHCFLLKSVGQEVKTVLEVNEGFYFDSLPDTI